MAKMSADEFKMLLIMSYDQQEYDSWEAFPNLIRGAVTMDRDDGYSLSFQEEYRSLIAANDVKGLTETLIAHQMDNYILGSIAAYQMGLPKSLPLIPYAAENKRLYEGWHGEISNLRTLMLFGFDIDAQMVESGNTALHAMCGLRWGKGVHNRAISLLLEAGADCNLKNNSGDTPLTYLAGSYPWTTEVHSAFTGMLEHGADPLIPANDGKTAMDLLRDNQSERDPNPGRLSLIEALELKQMVAEKRKASSIPRL